MGNIVFASAFNVAVAAAFGGMLVVNAYAETPQTFKATIGGVSFESDDDSIRFVPLLPSSSMFTFGGTSKGGGAWPLPGAHADRLVIVCEGFAGKPLKLTMKEFTNEICDVTFTNGVNFAVALTGADYFLDKANPDNVFEIVTVKGNVVEGVFSFVLKAKSSGMRLPVVNGRFKAEDRLPLQ